MAKIFVYFCKYLIISLIFFTNASRFLHAFAYAIAFLLSLHHRKPTFFRYEIITDQQFDQFWRELSGLGFGSDRAFLPPEPY